MYARNRAEADTSTSLCKPRAYQTHLKELSQRFAGNPCSVGRITGSQSPTDSEIFARGWNGSVGGVSCWERCLPSFVCVALPIRALGGSCCCRAKPPSSSVCDGVPTPRAPLPPASPGCHRNRPASKV